jgi:maleylacetate reductase
MMTPVHDFIFPGITTRVLFGRGTVGQAGPELERLGHKKALVLSTPQQAQQAQALSTQLGSLSAGIYAGAAMHTPVEVTEAALAAYGDSGATAVVSIGGGSTTGLGKAIAVRTGADQVVIPTTYAGSEMTDILGETQGGQKATRRDPAIRPETVIYDVDLTLTLPARMTVTSALNAIAHAVEALYAPDRNPVIELMCGSALLSFKEALPVLVEEPADIDARGHMLYGAWLCSTALGYASMALHHKICHTLGGFGLDHADTHAVMIPHTAGYNGKAVPALLAPVSAAFGGTPGAALHDFAQSLGAPMTLRELGLAEEDLDRAAELATRNPYANPRPFSPQEIRQLLEDAYQGTRPEY